MEAISQLEPENILNASLEDMQSKNIVQSSLEGIKPDSDLGGMPRFLPQPEASLGGMPQFLPQPESENIPESNLEGLPEHFPLTDLKSQLFWLIDVYAELTAFKNHQRHSEYVSITNYLKKNYSSEQLKETASKIYLDLTSQYRYDAYRSPNSDLQARNQAEMECLRHIDTNGKFPYVRYYHPKYAELEKYTFNSEMPSNFKDLIRCLTELYQPDLHPENRDYLENYRLTERDYEQFICKTKYSLFFENLLKDFPELRKHIESKLLVKLDAIQADDELEMKIFSDNPGLMEYLIEVQTNPKLLDGPSEMRDCLNGLSQKYPELLKSSSLSEVFHQIPESTVMVPKSTMMVPESTVMVSESIVMVPKSTVMVPKSTMMVPKSTVMVPTQNILTEPEMNMSLVPAKGIWTEHPSFPGIMFLT